MAGISPTQRTLRALEQQGCHSGIVERFNAHVGPFGNYPFAVLTAWNEHEKQFAIAQLICGIKYFEIILKKTGYFAFYS